MAGKDAATQIFWNAQNPEGSGKVWKDLKIDFFLKTYNPDGAHRIWKDNMTAIELVRNIKCKSLWNVPNICFSRCLDLNSNSLEWVVFEFKVGRCSYQVWIRYLFLTSLEWLDKNIEIESDHQTLNCVLTGVWFWEPLSRALWEPLSRALWHSKLLGIQVWTSRKKASILQTFFICLHFMIFTSSIVIL